MKFVRLKDEGMPPHGGPYQGRVKCKPGQSIQVEDEQASYLLKTFPDYFEEPGKKPAKKAPAKKPAKKSGGAAKKG